MNIVFNDSIRLYKDGHQKSFSRITTTLVFFVSTNATKDGGNGSSHNNTMQHTLWAENQHDCIFND